MRMVSMPSLTEEGLSKQDFKAGEVSVPTSGDQGNGDEDVILLLSDHHGDRRPHIEPGSDSGGNPPSGGRSSANCCRGEVLQQLLLRQPR